MTGPLAFLGTAQAAALEIAASEQNAAGKVEIQLKIEDSKGDARSAVAAAQKLLSVDRVDLAFVTTSALSAAVAPIFDEKGVPLVTICSDQSIAKRYPSVVNFYIGIGDEVDALSAALQAKSITKVSFLRIKASVAEDAVRLFREKAKATIITDTTYDNGQIDVRNDIAKIASDSSEALIIIGYGSEYPALLRQIRESDFQKPIFGNYTFTSAAARKEGTGDLSRVTFTAFPISTQKLSESPFGKSYTAKTGSPPGAFLDYLFAYEALTKVGEFVGENGKPASFPQLFRGREFPSYVGPITIDRDGNAQVRMTTATYSPDGSIHIK